MKGYAEWWGYITIKNKMQKKLCEVLKNHIIELICYVTIISISILIFIRTETYGIINIGDTLFPFFPEEAFSKYIYLSWWELNLGFSHIVGYTSLPLYLYRAVLDFISIPLWLNNRIYFVLPVALVGMSMYHLLSILLMGPHKTISRFMASFFIIINPFMISLIHGGSIPLIFSLSAGIFMLSFYIKGLNNEHGQEKYILLFGLFSVALAMGQVVGAVLLIPITLYFFFYLTTKRKKFFCLKFTFYAVFVSLALNSWWLISMLDSTFNSNILSIIYADNSAYEVLKYTQSRVGFTWVLRLLYGGLKDVISTVSYAPYYLSATGIFIGFILLILAFSSLLFKNENKYKNYFAILALFSAIFSTGIHYTLFANVYMWMWNNIPMFQVFRVSLKFSFLLLIAFACLIGISVQEISCFIDEKTSKRNRNYIVGSFLTFVIVLISMNAWPLLTGNLAGHLTPIDIPSDYYNSREYLVADSEVSRVFVLPLQTWYLQYTWAPYDMQDILVEFSPKPIISPSPGSRPHGVIAVLYNYSSDENSGMARLLGLLNIKYTLLHDDIKEISVSKFQRDLNNSEGICFKKSFGKLYLYEIENRYLLPNIYAANDIINVQGDINPNKQ